MNNVNPPHDHEAWQILETEPGSHYCGACGERVLEDAPMSPEQILADLAEPALVANVAALDGRWVADPHVPNVWGYFVHDLCLGVVYGYGDFEGFEDQL